MTRLTNIHIAESCTTNQFKCADGQCIPSEKRCDNTFDCTDRSDEVNCSDPSQCPEGLHRCDNEECVTDLNQCPTPTLIYTATDMFSISTSQLQSSSSYIVATSSLYMSKSSVTDTTSVLVESVTPTTEDHTPDADNSNLLYLLFLLLFIPIGLAFQCSNGQCIPSEHRCDAEFHCEDRSDELNYVIKEMIK
ncbi:LRP2 [Mytilus coruscus]|uniref:LRP2 n=1 Tax=Mytilus coruscus TaxID=42192 RepID=A0A6J8ESE7_MYTCO|nr:LRP2 [Mytilus coruscus]